jgi:ribosomal protein S18 acetylase RimI-like enzyme
MDVRPYRPADEDAVVGLWRRCGLIRPQNDPRKDIARKLRVQPEMFLVAVAGGEVVGSVMCGYEGHRGWINYLAVDPRMRLRGVGRQLMAEAERVLRAAGCPKINLQVRSTNEAVLAFYAAIGFAVDDVVSLGRRLERD